MIKRFNEIILNKYLLKSTDRFLLAVSGGRDSMAMTHLFLKSGYDFGVAHFNHVTRSGESDRDENFVRSVCEMNNITFYTQKVNISSLMQNGEGNNFHDLARKYRYEWLEKIRSDHGYDFIATAHNRDDQIETFLYKISKGSGINGLGGIKTSLKKIIRPLLEISREEINDYIRSENIPHIEDSSNEKTDYDRNFIRHKLIPEFRNLHDNFDTRIITTIRNLSSTNELFEYLISEFSKPYIQYKKSSVLIDKKLFNGSYPKFELLFQIVHSYGFNMHQCSDILKAINNTGTFFEANDYRLTIDREFITILKTDWSLPTYFIIEGQGIFKTGDMQVSIIATETANSLNSETGLFYVDAEKLKFPVILRDRLPGDKFRPFGLNGKETKLKKFLTDKKVTTFDKKNLKVLVSNSTVFLIENIEINYNFRVTNETKKMYAIEIKRLTHP